MAINPRMVLRYINISVGSDHFLELKFLKFNIFWSFQKIDYFWEYEAFVFIGGGGGRGVGLLTKLD